MSQSFEVNLDDHIGRFAWDCTNPDGSSPPLEFNEIQPAPNLATGERGALIFPVVFRGVTAPGSSPSRMLLVGDFEPLTVIAGLLLFDRLDHPIHTMVCPEPGIPAGLEDWPGFQRSLVRCGGNMSFGMYSQIAGALFNVLDAREAGLWSMVRNADGVGLPLENLTPQAAFQLRLADALPMPDRAVPYEDVLMFKDRRRAELMSLRWHLDELVLEVARAGFGGLAESLAFEKFHHALTDHAKAMRETNFPKRMLNIDISINWGELLKNTAITGSLTAVAGHFMGLPGVGAAIGIMNSVAPGLSFSSAFGLKRPEAKPSPFEYLIQAGREL